MEQQEKTIDAVLQAIETLSEQMTELREELIEKLNNLSIGGADYDIDTFEES
jgi:hypothetical protein